MAGRRDKLLIRPSQRTEKGSEVPVPKRDDFFGALDKVAKKPGPGEKPSRRVPERP